jgi:hypothetical protein
MIFPYYAIQTDIFCSWSKMGQELTSHPVQLKNESEVIFFVDVLGFDIQIHISVFHILD